MVLPTTTRENAINTLKRIRSKAIDTERLLLRDAATLNDVVTRAEEISGQAKLLALSVFTTDNTSPKHKAPAYRAPRDGGRG
jgi:hypothetical protein